MMTTEIINKLLQSVEPSIRYKILVKVLEVEPTSLEVEALREEIKTSPRVQQLLSEKAEIGEIPGHPYNKWYGAHWVLADLAELGYPAGDESLIPLREQVYGWLFGRSHQQGIRTIQGRVRRCASQEGNALHSFLCLGLAEARVERLVECLLQWQWPDGGWNCDKRPGATHSSFMETLIPLRALALYARSSGHRAAQEAVERAAEIFLKRRLYRRQKDERVIDENFIKLHYPCYWHYDILFGLKVMAEAGFIDDPRCNDALDLLESKRLADGGFPAEKKYYRVSDRRQNGDSLVDWGGTSKVRLNEFVTADALYVLKQANRL
jgi:hypothetical protein